MTVEHLLASVYVLLLVIAIMGVRNAWQTIRIRDLQNELLRERIKRQKINDELRDLRDHVQGAML